MTKKFGFKDSIPNGSVVGLELSDEDSTPVKLKFVWEY